MAAETQTLNFGPEWLRALSSGGTVTSPPLSPALPKYKLADYRYGREEMLALYLKDNKIPSDLMDKEFLPILQEEPLPPLALVPFTEEEQRNFSISVNSTAVLRIMGRGGGTVVGAPRGRSTSRGRGRGRGEGGFYQRSFDEVESSFGRGTREMHRSQSWEERGDRRFEKPGRKEPDSLPNSLNMSTVPGSVKTASEQKIMRPTFEECGTTAGKKLEFTRSESDNWRHLKEEMNGGEDEESGIWRTTVPRKEGDRWPRPPSPEILHAPGWREAVERRRRFEFDFRERDDERGYRRLKPGSTDDDKDILPEWCLEDAEEETGTFDSSGAFLPSKKVQKQPIPEEQELDFRPSDDREEHSDSDGSHSEKAKESDKIVKEENKRPEQLSLVKERTESLTARRARKGESRNCNWEKQDVELGTGEPATHVEVRASSPTRWLGTTVEPPLQEPASCNLSNIKEERIPEQMKKQEEQKKSSPQIKPSTKAHKNVKEVVPAAVQPERHNPLDAAAAKTPLSSHVSRQTSALRQSNSPVTGAPGMGNISTEMEDDDGLKHLEQAEKMVAYLQDSALDDERLASKIKEHRTKGSALPLPQETMQKWFYKDPQGAIQGPFSNQEMAEWCQAGYFTMSLLVRRACDDSFQPLGDLMKLWGRMPFTSGPVPPKLLGDLDLERRTRQQEITTLYHLHHLQYQQFILQQQYAQLLAEQQKTALSSQQQQQLAVLLQQFQALKIRISEQNLVHPVSRAMSVPDTSSVWELQTPISQPAAWEGNSVWDLPDDPGTPVTSSEKLQLEKAKAAKLEQERRDQELRAKQLQEEEEKKRQEDLRRQQEELRRQQEELRHQQAELLRRQQEDEERKRREEEELARRKQEEALKRQREQETALRRQREEEERQQQADALKQLEERRKKEEEEQRRKDEIIQKQEEAARWAREEEEAAQRLAEENRLKMEQEASKLHHEEEERKKKDSEVQRQKELQRQRQQQQEALRRLQQQQMQMAQMKLPSSSTWGQQASTAAVIASQSSLSLAEIQKLEEERERQLQDEQTRQQRELMKTLQQQQLQQQQQQKLSGWGTVSTGTGSTKSLLEIQKEEAKQMQKNKQENRARGNSTVTTAAVCAADTISTTITTCSIQTNVGNSVWGTMNTSPTSHWTSDSVSSIWSNADSKNSNLGFWDDAAKDVGPSNTASRNKSKNNSSLSKSAGSTSRQNKKVEEEEKLLKLFQGMNKVQDGFTQWCEQMLHALNTANNLDVPTFVCFLKEVESAYEVHDYIRAYLGDTPEAKEFGKKFIERRAKQKTNQQRQQPQLKQDSVWGLNHPAVQSVFQTNQSNNQQSSYEAVQSAGKKKKKQRMVRADPSLLGFSVNASSERLNMGEIETLEEL
ncbi:GRB10-interacting GYF protein 2 isoform X3 [Ambystoma mexicanum]|uniref:GRB10-interacting GYF protein 2 isoform X3 n=1 Tax=Ambystoma mexicanum TaxID=8296 RepID=UPI0037E99845